MSNAKSFAITLHPARRVRRLQTRQEETCEKWYRLKTLSALVHEAGFKIGKVEGLFLKPFTTSQLSSLDLSPTIGQALLEVSADHPEISNAIYVEVTE